MRKSKSFIPVFLLIASIGLYSCATIPKTAVPVTNFDKSRYLNKWYEIARIDFKFEKNLNNTIALYSLNDNGSIKVVNRGYNTVKKQWKEATGKAKFVKDDKTGMLKVSFFGPFYSGYNVIDLDDDYKYALIAGKNYNYLWILSRETTIPENIKTQFLKTAAQSGFNTSELLWVSHNDQK